MGRCGAVCQCLTRQVLPLILVRFFTGLGLLLAVTVTSTMPAQAQFNAAIESQSPNQGLPHGPLPNDCGLRAVIFLLAEKGLYPALQTLVNLLSHRYTTTGGKPIGEGYSLSDLQWVLESFGVNSRGFFVSRSWLQEDKPPAMYWLWKVPPIPSITHYGEFQLRSLCSRPSSASSVASRVAVCVLVIIAVLALALSK